MSEDNNNRIRAAIPMGVIGSIIVAALWINSTVKDLQYEIRSLTDEVQQLRAAAWTRREMQTWVDLLRARNPDFKVPLMDKEKR